jgi:hypothetical protein
VDFQKEFNLKVPGVSFYFFHKKSGKGDARYFEIKNIYC